MSASGTNRSVSPLRTRIPPSTVSTVPRRTEPSVVRTTTSPPPPKERRQHRTNGAMGTSGYGLCTVPPVGNRSEGGTAYKIPLPKELSMLSYLLLLACAPAPQENPTAEEILRKVREVIPKNPKYTADFEEVRSLGPTTMRAKGRVSCGGNRLIRLELETRMSPAMPGMPEKGSQTLVADGEYLWVEAPGPFSSEKIFFRGRLDDLERQAPGGRLPQTPDDPSKAIDQLVEQYAFVSRGE